ncbi:MAG: hypothetical protein ACKOU6_14890 [Planctomycetota bacterium]
MSTQEDERQRQEISEHIAPLFDRTKQVERNFFPERSNDISSRPVLTLCEKGTALLVGSNASQYKGLRPWSRFARRLNTRRDGLVRQWGMISRLSTGR